ncbi:hybrid sensor histidine kinase/response regulator [Azohydromonas aeria]|uniref:hybrid sensor histidine kinase/response regulator n=1 Tax=Azohydromonas aeria TaxID=2590212 RepID=UPI0012F80CBF|nr:ATP-binding protein [Azohydromonas aeria]
MPRRFSVRSWLVLLALSVLLPTLLAAVMSIAYFYKEERQSSEARVLETARAMSMVVDRELARREGVVKTLAKSPALVQGNLETFYRYARDIAPQPDMAVVLSDISGQQVLNTRRPFGEGSLPRTVFSKLREQADPLATLVSDLYFAPIGKQYSFAVEVPVVVDGRLRHYLSMGGYANYLQDLLKEQRLPDSWIGTVVDRNGFIVARTIGAEQFVGKLVPEALLKQLMAHQEGALETLSIDGRPVLAVFSKGSKYGWSFVIGVPQAEVATWSALALSRFASTAALLAVAVVIGALWVGRALTRPVVALKHAAHALGQGSAATFKPTGVVEIDEVAVAMSDAADSLRNASAVTQRRISEALEQAEQAHRAMVQGQRLEAVAHLTGGVAHDFNNLLMVVGTNMHILRRTGLSAVQESCVSKIERAVSSGTKLTRQLLTFSRRQPMRPEVIDLREQLPSLTALMRSALHSRIELRSVVEPARLHVEVDPNELELALINLAVNARDAMPDGGALHITARLAHAGEMSVTPAQHVVLEVRDTGTGIAPDLVGKVFEPFFTTKPVGHGTGLGLSQVYGLCVQSGGVATIESELGRGTTVRMYLPLSSKPLASEVRQSATTGTDSINARVLLVEDNEDLAQAAADVLVAAGCQVEKARTGDDAVIALEVERPFDVVLSDIRMPGSVDGIALAHRIAQSGQPTGVILMTGFTAELQKARDMGFLVLPKPCPAEDLLAQVRAVAAKAADAGINDS